MCDVIDSKRVFTIIFVFVLREINYTLLAHFRTHTKMYSFSIPFSTFHRYRFSSSKKKSAQLFTAQLEIAKSFSIFLVITQSAVRINTLMPICKAKKKINHITKLWTDRFQATTSISCHITLYCPFWERGWRLKVHSITRYFCARRKNPFAHSAHLLMERLLNFHSNPFSLLFSSVPFSLNESPKRRRDTHPPEYVTFADDTIVW